MDLIDELSGVGRAVGLGVLPAGPARAVALDRVYPVEVSRVWTALTDQREVSAWLSPVTSDLREGGNFEIEDTASGRVRVCEPPHHVRLTWLLGPESRAGDSSLVDVRLSPMGHRTRIALRHVSVVPEEAWRQFGPGAVGVGWDVCLLGLAGHLGGVPLGDVSELLADPWMRDAIVASSQAWGEAYRATGASARDVAASTAATTAFYAPPMEA